MGSLLMQILQTVFIRLLWPCAAKCICVCACARVHAHPCVQGLCAIFSSCLLFCHGWLKWSAHAQMHALVFSPNRKARLSRGDMSLTVRSARDLKV